MTLLRMLAFRPADGSTATGGASPAGRSEPVATAKPASKAPQSSAAKVAQGQSWSDPDWGELVPSLGLSGAVRLLASNCAYLRREGNTVYLGLDPRSDSLLTKPRKDALAARLSEHFGESLNVDIALSAETDETPVQQESRIADERIEKARQTLEADPNVQAMKNMFGAEIKTETIELINPPQSD